MTSAGISANFVLLVVLADPLSIVNLHLGAGVRASGRAMYVRRKPKVSPCRVTEMQVTLLAFRQPPEGRSGRPRTSNRDQLSVVDRGDSPG